MRRYPLGNFANGRSVSREWPWVNLSVLRAIGHHLVDIHGRYDRGRVNGPRLNHPDVG